MFEQISRDLKKTCDLNRQLLSVVFFIMLFAPTLLTYTWLRVYKDGVKREIKKQLANGLEKDQLVRLKFSKSDAEKLHWEHAAEFEYKGEMYDVISSEERGDSITYHCWWDNEETQLNKKLSQLVERALGTNQERDDHQDRLISFFKSFFYTPTYEVGERFASIEDIVFFVISQPLCTVDFEIPTPPPQFC